LRKRTLLPAAPLTTGLLTALPAATACAAPSGRSGGTSSGVTITGAVTLGPSSAGVPTTGSPRFGFAILR